MVRDILDTVSSSNWLTARLVGAGLFKHSGIKIPRNPVAVNLKTIAHKPLGLRDGPTVIGPAVIRLAGHARGVHIQRSCLPVCAPRATSIPFKPEFDARGLHCPHCLLLLRCSKGACHDAGLTQTELDQRAGVARTTVARMETLAKGDMSVSTLLRLLQAVG